MTYGEYVHQHTLRKDVHGVVNLNIHMVTNGSQLVLLGRDDFAILALDLPRGASLLCEPARNDNALAIFFGLVGFFALVLDGDSNLGHTCRGREATEN